MLTKETDMYLSKEELIAKIQDIEWDDFEAKASKTQLPADTWRTVSACAFM